MLSLVLLVHIERVTGSFALAGLVSGSYTVGLGVGAPILGRLVDRYGQLAVLVMTAFATSVLLGAVALLPASAPGGTGRARGRHWPGYAASQWLRACAVAKGSPRRRGAAVRVRRRVVGLGADLYLWAATGARAGRRKLDPRCAGVRGPGADGGDGVVCTVGPWIPGRRLGGGAARRRRAPCRRAGPYPRRAGARTRSPGRDHNQPDGDG